MASQSRQDWPDQKNPDHHHSNSHRGSAQNSAWVTDGGAIDVPTDELQRDGPQGSSVKKVSIRRKDQGCCSSLMRAVRCLWATRYTENTEGNRELHVKTTLRELIVYLVFLTVICVITFGMTSTTMFYYTKVLSDLFLDTTADGSTGSFKQITNTAEFWKFARSPLLKGLYWETWYNNVSIPEEQRGFIYYENKLLGVPRIRQLKVHRNSCVVHEDFHAEIRDCFDAYTKNIEDTATFGPGSKNIGDNDTAWSYQTEAELDGSNHWGKLATYSGAGYVRDLEKDKKSADETINYLFSNRWIDRGTRALFIDFTVYNANINLFCVIRLVVEFPATGGAIPSWIFRTVKLIRYVTAWDFFVLACECIFVIFILYYVIEEILEIKRHKLKYFKSFWNIIDILVLIIATVCIVFHVYRTISVDNMLKTLLNKPDEYPDFEFLSYWQMQFNNIMAVAVFFAWVKIFKYISFNKTMTQLSSTLARCAKDLAGFAVMFFIIFLAFAQLGYLIFGTQVKDFSTFSDAIFTLFRIILGDFDFQELEAAHRVLGPMYFILYVFFVFFVLLNMFLAIINDTYSDVKADLANQKNEFEMTDYFKRGYNKMLEKLNFKRDKIIDIQKALRSADINSDKQVDFDEWRNDLKSRGYADGEIEAMFAKYDEDGDRVLSEKEQRTMQDDLERKKADLHDEYTQLEQKTTSRGRASDTDSDDDDAAGKARGGGGSGVSYEEFTVLSRRVDRMEHSIGSIVSKIDAVLVKLEAMEKAKMKRRETMGKILDSITESDATSDEMKREQMERLVREELERWDSETSINPASARGQSPGASSGRSTRKPPSNLSSGRNSPPFYPSSF